MYAFAHELRALADKVDQLTKRIEAAEAYLERLDEDVSDLERSLQGDGR